MLIPAFVSRWADSPNPLGDLLAKGGFMEGWDDRPHDCSSRRFAVARFLPAKPKKTRR